MHQAKQDAIALVSNRHLVLENYQQKRMRSDYVLHHFNDAAFMALRDQRRDAGLHYSDRFPREVITLESYDLADEVDAALVASMPEKYVSDPSYTFGVSQTGINAYGWIENAPKQAQDRMDAMIVRLLTDLGVYSRVFVRAMLGS
jgi:hypothetical protein